MLPSKGLRILRGCNLGPSSKRQFSSIINSTTRTASVLSNPSLTFSNPQLRPKIPGATAPIILNGILLPRFASTQSPSDLMRSNLPPQTPTPAPPTEATPPTEVTPPNDFDLRSAFEFDHTQITEGIGYLKSLGLDFGWGPTACVQWLLEHIHFYSGAPWWVSIAAMSILIRVVMLKLYINASNNSARMVAIRPIAEIITKEMKEAQARGDRMGMLGARQQLKQLNKKAGVQLWMMLAPLLQMFIGYGSFRLLRSMAELPVPGWENAGIPGWFPDLTVADPFYIMPTAIGAMTYFIMKKGGDMGTSAAASNPMVPNEYLKYMQIGIPIATFAFMSFMTAGAQWYFLITSACSGIQTMIFSSPRCRNIIGMDPLPKPKAPAPKPSFAETGAARKKQVPKRIVTLSDVRRMRQEKGSYEAPRSLSRTPRAPQQTPPKQVYVWEKEGRAAVVDMVKRRFGKGLSTIKESLLPSSVKEEDFEREERRESPGRRSGKKR